MNNSEIEQDEVKIYDFKKKTWRDDVTFLVEDQRFYASKVILAIDSPVFEAMFGTNFKEREETEILLPGKNPEDFNVFLQFIYPKTQKKIDADNVYKILPLADEYDVKSLVRKCRRYLSSHLRDSKVSTEEIILCHVLATRYKFQDLRDVCSAQLSDICLKDIQSTDCKDTEALLELHKDVLMNQEKTFERTRTELVDVYMNSDLSLDTVSTCDFSNVKGALIQFKPFLDVSIEDRKESNTVSLWDITFKVVVEITRRDHADHVSVLLSSSFPETDQNLACLIDAKLQIRNIGQRYYHEHIFFSFNDKEYSKEAQKSAYGFRRKLLDLIVEGYFVDKQVDVVVYFKVKMPFIKDQ